MILSVDVLTPVLMCTLKLVLQMATDYSLIVKKCCGGNNLFAIFAKDLLFKEAET
jgi:hypothetical protein